MMGNFYLLNKEKGWAAVCISKCACTSLKIAVLADRGITVAGKDAIHNRIGYTEASPFLVPVSHGPPPGYFCFAVWRDPMERFESVYRHFGLDGVRQAALSGLPRNDPAAWVSFAEEHLQKPITEQDEHLRRQSDYYHPSQVHEIIPLLALDSWFAARGWGRLPRSNRSRHPFNLTEALARRITGLYANDYSLISKHGEIQHSPA